MMALAVTSRPDPSVSVCGGEKKRRWLLFLRGLRECGAELLLGFLRSLARGSGRGGNGLAHLGVGLTRARYGLF